MGTLTLDDIAVNKLNKFNLPAGDVMHALKYTEKSFNGFGETYFSLINPGFVKAWKRHTLMTMNLVVPFGAVIFVFALSSDGPFRKIQLDSHDNYSRITVPPGIWFGFKCLSDTSSIILNISDIPYNPIECDRQDLDFFNFDWSLV